jgi:drug/metabolite transporter (DMT)-like permease
MTASFLAAIFALLAAVAWGSGDFTNGLVARQVGPFIAVFVSYHVGLVVLVIVALAGREPLSAPIDLIWGALAGISGMAGLVFLLRGFSAGRMGIVAPVSAVLATTLPVLFAAITEGLPRNLQLAGFGLGLVSIYLLSRPEKLAGRPAGLGMALLAGLGFGGLFIMLGQIDKQAVFWPLAAGRLACCVLLLAFALATHRPVTLLHAPLRAPLALMGFAGAVDVTGNLFFLLAVQSERLDVAAVLGSFYPAVTAILAWLISREKMARLQVFGAALAVIAIMLISI